MSVSDLMSGLMLVFLMISVFFMLQVQAPAIEHLEREEALVAALTEEFEDDFPTYRAEFDSAKISIVFTEPEILFESGETSLREAFRIILRDFFPRYVSVLGDERFQEYVAEVRIEGHTSSVWVGSDPSDPIDAYVKNMNLSQGRSREVLEFVVRLPGVEQQWDEWLKEPLTANGLSSSQLRFVDNSGLEDAKGSRRVEFRVRLDTDETVIQSAIWEDDETP